METAGCVLALMGFAVLASTVITFGKAELTL